MRYAVGYSYYYDDDGLTIKDAVVTENHISIDWEDDAGKGHLEADSADDFFQGTYGYKDEHGLTPPQAIRHFQLKRFSSGDGEILLLGQWWEDGGNDCPWLIHLTEPLKAKT